MRRMAAVGAAIVAALSAVLWPAQAHAGEVIPVYYSAPEECPEGGAFLQQVGDRVPWQLQLADTEASARFRVVISLSDGAFVGRIDGNARSGIPVERTLTDAQCSELVSALALVTALSINPPSSGVASPLKPAAEPPRAQRRALPLQKRRARLHGRVGVGWDVIGGIAPKVGIASADVSSQVAYDWSESLSAVFGAGLVLGRAADSPRIGVDVGYRWLLLRLSACPVEYVFSAAVRLGACGGWQVGDVRVVGSGSGLERSETAHLLWSSLDATLRGGVKLWRPLWLDLEGGAVLPFQTASFVLSAPRTLVYRSSGVGFLCRTGLIVQFP